MTTAYVLLSFATPVLYSLLTVAAYYLFSRAMITSFLWKRYPSWLNYYTWCAACSGTLYGVVAALAVGWTRDLPFFGLPGRFWPTPVLVGLSSMIWTPILANAHITALVRLGIASTQADVLTLAHVAPNQSSNSNGDSEEGGP